MKTNVQQLQGGRGGERHVLFVGANERTVRLVKALPRGGVLGCHIEGFLDDDPNRGHILENHGVHCLGQIGDLERVLTERVVDCVYVCLPLRSSYDAVQGIVGLCERGGVPVCMPIDLLESPLAARTQWRMDDKVFMSVEVQPREGAMWVAQRARRSRAYARLTAMLLPFAILVTAFLGRGNGMPNI